MWNFWMEKNELKDVILVRLANFPLGEIGHLDCRGNQGGRVRDSTDFRYIFGSFFLPSFLLTALSFQSLVTSCVPPLFPLFSF